MCTYDAPASYECTFIAYRLDIGHHHSPTKMLRPTAIVCAGRLHEALDGFSNLRKDLSFAILSLATTALDGALESKRSHREFSKQIDWCWMINQGVAPRACVRAGAQTWRAHLRGRQRGRSERASGRWRTFFEFTAYSMPPNLTCDEPRPRL